VHAYGSVGNAHEGHGVDATGKDGRWDGGGFEEKSANP